MIFTHTHTHTHTHTRTHSKGVRELYSLHEEYNCQLKKFHSLSFVEKVFLNLYSNQNKKTFSKRMSVKINKKLIREFFVFSIEGLNLIEK